MKSVLKYAAKRTRLMVAMMFISVSQLANAAVTLDEATGNLTGSIDMGFYLSAVGIAVAALSLVVAVTLGIRTFKGTKNI